jgi:hypothetical protein
MTKREIAILAFKILSIYAFIQAIDQSSYVLYCITSQDQFDPAAKVELIWISVPPMLLALCGTILWFTAPFLATSVFKTTGSEYASTASLADIQMVAFSVVGLFILATGFPELVNVLTVNLTASWIEGGWRAKIHNIVVLVLKIALGLWLLLGSDGIVSFIRKRRTNP